MNEFLIIPKWRDYQHYKDRSPPWIKLHFDLLTSESWIALDDASRVLAIACMLIASRNDGKIPNNPVYMQRVAYLSSPANFKPLINCGFLVEMQADASVMLANASALQADASPEQSREEKRREETTLSGKPDPTDLFGKAEEKPTPTPKDKINGHRTEATAILAFLNEKTGRAFRPLPANLEMIAARLKEGATVSDCRKVIVRKTMEWGPDEKMHRYLRPATLFNRTNFAQYSGELVVAPEDRGEQHG